MPFNIMTSYLKFAIIMIIPLLASCIRSNVFEKNAAIKNHAWQENFQPAFTFTITDTVSSYSMFFTIRHTDAYPYSNIWLSIGLKFPGADTAVNSKMEIPLADLDGKWYGRGMNEVWEQQMPMFEGLHFSKTGTYSVSLKQIMRINPLPEVMSVGVRLEKNKK